MKRLCAADLPSLDVVADAQPAPLTLSLADMALELALARAEALRTAERRIQRVAPRADRAPGLLETTAKRADPARIAALAVRGRLLLRAV